MRPVLIALSLTLALPGCARLAASPVNPLNWFGVTPAGPQVVATAPAGPASLVPANAGPQVIELRQPVAQVTALRLDANPDGVLVTASGRAAQPGAFNAALVETGRAGGTLTLELRAEQPAAPRAGASQVTAGLMLSNAVLAGVSTIVVASAGNSLSARR